MTRDRDWRDQWALQPGVSYLNHGSFGPSPKVVSQARAEWAARLEANPMDFLFRQLDGHLFEVRRRLGALLGAPAEDLVMIENATFGMNVVAESFCNQHSDQESSPLKPGDEVLINDHEYGAVLRIWTRVCQRTGARLVVTRLPVPLESEDQVVDRLLAEATDRTRLLVFSHVTSPTAIVLPAAALARRARSLGLTVCIDGPHAPAMVPVDIGGLDCDFYTASCHKWLSAPFGSGFLYVHPRSQHLIQPTNLSWGRSPPGKPRAWIDEFTWAGTRDPSAFLAVPAAIDFLEAVGLPVFREQTHALAREFRQRVTELTGLPPLTPDSPQWYGSMVAVPLPPGPVQPLQDELWARHQIEIPVIDWQGQRLIRVSCHLYTQPEEIDAVVQAIKTAIGKT